MPRILLYLAFACVILSCKKDMPEPPTVAGGGYGTTTIYPSYDVTFWSDSPGTQINVSIDGQGGTITVWYSLSAACNASGCASFSLPPGTYPYTASNLSGSYWSGTIVTTGGPQCVTVLLH